jgi:hypothetical protein
MVVINIPGDYRDLIGGLPDGARIVEEPGERVDFVHLFVSGKAELERYIDVAIDTVKYDGLLWVSYPKGSSRVETDVNRDVLWELLKAKGIRPVMQVSINETWSALRFRPAEAVGT